MEEIRGKMHDTLSATLGRVIGQGEKPPFCQQPGPDGDGEPESRIAKGWKKIATTVREQGQKWHSRL